MVGGGLERSDGRFLRLKGGTPPGTATEEVRNHVSHPVHMSDAAGGQIEGVQVPLDKKTLILSATCLFDDGGVRKDR